MHRHSLRLALTTLAALAILSLLTGCASLQAAFGTRVSLEDTDLHRLEAALGAESLCPGGQAPLIVTAFFDDGEYHRTRGAGEGRLGWDNFNLQIHGAVDLTDEGMVVMSNDAYAVLGADSAILISSRYHDDEPIRVDVPSRFNCAYTVDFSGDSGRNGTNGQSGSNGNHGTGNQSSGSYAQPGGHGGDGAHGGNGTDGESGRNGDEVEVRVALVDGAAPALLDVRVASVTTGESRHYIVDPRQGGAVSIIARGGNGGKGGNGGYGGTGGSGGTGSPPGNGGNGGDGGDGGNGADGGDGGRVTFFVSASAEPYVGVLSADTSGGHGGAPGSGGPGASGGNAHSGANAGRSGTRGRDGTRAGRPGRNGPPAEIVYVD